MVPKIGPAYTYVKHNLHPKALGMSIRQSRVEVYQCLDALSSFLEKGDWALLPRASLSPLVISHQPYLSGYSTPTTYALRYSRPPLAILHDTQLLPVDISQASYSSTVTDLVTSRQRVKSKAHTFCSHTSTSTSPHTSSLHIDNVARILSTQEELSS
jgi:hypothetical protein